MTSKGKSRRVKAIGACVECDAEICFAGGEGVCRRRLSGWLPPKFSLPLRLFVEEATAELKPK